MHPLVRANFRLLVIEIGWFGLAVAATSRFVSVYAIRLGASPAQLGLLVAMPGIALLLATPATMHWRSRYTSTMQSLFWPSLGFRFVFLLPALIPFLPTAWRPLGLIIAMTLPAFPQGIASGIFITMMRETVDNDHFAVLVGRRQLAFNVAIGAGALSFGFWLNHGAFPLNYQLMFVAAFILSLISLRFVFKIRPSLVPEPSPKNLTGGSDESNPWHDPDFQKSAVVVTVTLIAFFSILPMVPLYLVSELGADEGFMAVFGMVEVVGGALGAAYAAQLMTSIGHRGAIALAMLGTALGAVIIVASTSLTATLAAAFITGASWVTADIGQFVFFSRNVPQMTQRYSTAYFQLVSVTIVIGPMIGSSIANQGVDLALVLLLGISLRLLAGAFIFLCCGEKRATLHGLPTH